MILQNRIINNSLNEILRSQIRVIIDKVIPLLIYLTIFPEYSAHPYLFFNPDHNTMTFIGFNIDKYSRSLVDQQTMVTLERNIMSKLLWDALRENNVPLQENFDDLSRYDNSLKLTRPY